MSVKSYFIQMYGFLVKTFTQRWRTPITSLLELLLPCIFTLLMAVCYWTSDSTHVPAKIYDGFDSTPLDLNAMTSMYFCTMPGGTAANSPWTACNMTLFPFKCLELVGSGKDICMTYTHYGTLSGMLYSVYYGTGTQMIFNMDTYLALSAMVSETTRKEDPTFFGRSAKASLSHYGELLVASDDTALGEAFIDFCKQESYMCNEVVHSTVFATLNDAQDYAASHADRVWAIVDLPHNTIEPVESAVFTISMNYSATPWTFKQSSKSLFSRGLGDDDGGDPYILYWGSGFLTLQGFVQQFYLDRTLSLGLSQVGPAYWANASAADNVSRYLTVAGPAALMPMPTTPHFDNAFLTDWIDYMPLIAMLAALFPIARLTALIVEEKPQGIREAMLIMGLHRSCLFAGWYASALVVDFVASLLAAMVFKIGFLEHVNYGILLAVYFSFMQQNTAMSILISTLFSNPRAASWCAAFMVFLCAMPYYSLPEGMSADAMRAVALVPCVAYAESFHTMVEYASFGWSFGWSQARSGTFSVEMAIGMMWVSFTVMMILALYLDRVWPANVGRASSPLFFLKPLVRKFYQPKPKMIAMSSPHPKRPAGGTVLLDEVGMSTSLLTSSSSQVSGSEYMEHRHDVVDTSDPEVAAVFSHLRKIYYCGGFFGFFYTFFTGMFRKGHRVAALEDVTFAMRTGEVSVLLGPNGAGKSTIIGIATGMIKPTHGSVYIRGYSADHDLDKCRENIGYCPQSDIVWDSLTVEEHLSFYARLKGSNTFDVSSAVNKVLDLVGLEEKRDCKAGDLSGGQRRRLCVGVALVGDSSVLFLDEPTAGMDVKGRRTVYAALNRARENRSVLICTHLLDEADRIGDRVFIVNAGKLCGEGSPFYLKEHTGAGYIVTCVIDTGLSREEEAAAVSRLIDFVHEKGYEGHHPASDEVQAIPPTCLLRRVERRGREVSFHFPMTLLSASGRSLLTHIQQHREELHLRGVGLSVTTLEEALKTITNSATSLQKLDVGTANDTLTAVGTVAADGKKKELVQGDATAEGAAATTTSTASSEADDGVLLGEEGLYSARGGCATFGRHFRALFLKRLHCAKRDMRLLTFQVVIPVFFLLLALLINLIRAQSQPDVTLDMPSLYGAGAESEVLLANGLHPFAAVMYTMNAFQVSASTPDVALGVGYSARYVPVSLGNINGSYDISLELEAEVMNHTMNRYIAVSPSNMVVRSAMPTPAPVLLHNVSAPHAAPMAMDVVYNLGRYQMFGPGATPRLIARNAPMKMGPFESQLVETSKQVLIGMFIILPFILIPSNTISYIVREQESGARHMQWLSGANVAAYWLSVSLFDALCYIVTVFLSYMVFLIFNRTEFIGEGMVGPSIVLFLFFGFSSIPFSYVLGFFFRSPFTAQTVVLLVNFVFGFLWVTIESLLAPSALQFVKWVTVFLRVLPSVSFGEGMYVITGQELATMMFPSRGKPNMYELVSFTSDGRHTGGIGTGLIYMGSVLVVSVVLLIVLEYLRVQRFTSGLPDLHCCRKDVDDEGDNEANVADPGHASVVEEEQRVCAVSTGPAQDSIALQHLHKRYFGTTVPAVKDVSLGVHEGEVMGLLGLNGAGKTTTVSILAGEVVASKGAAYVNHVSVNSDTSRSYVGYCPQYDALLDDLSPKEHLWLYARLRNVREELIDGEVRMLLHNLGLYPHRTQAAHALSGGNKRRLSLAISLVGHTTSVLLDEPTAGMDAVARSQTCAMVRRLTQKKSVVLTTHLLDEAEALADRVSFMARGSLRCVGTPQEVKTTYWAETMYYVKVLFQQRLSRTETEQKQIEERIQKHVLEVVQNGEMGENATCKVAEVYPSSIVLEVNGALNDICQAVSDLRSGVVEEVPIVNYVSVSQPTLEDVLLLE